MGKSYREPGRYNKERRLHDVPSTRHKPLTPKDAQQAYERDTAEWIEDELKESEYADH